MDPLSLIWAKANLALYGISGYLADPKILFVCAVVATLLSLALIHKKH